MNVRNVSYSFIGGLMLAGICASCVNDSYRNKAKEKAVQYLNGEELLKAERFERQQYEDDMISANLVTYWDSLYIEGKSKEAYAKGQQLIRDSLNGIHHRKEKFQPKLDTILQKNMVNNQQENVAKIVSAKEFLQYRSRIPEKESYANELPYKTHYWNLITLAGRQNEAYQKGMADARKELNNK